MSELVKFKKPEDMPNLPDLPGLEEAKPVDRRLMIIIFSVYVTYLTILIFAKGYKYISYIDFDTRLYLFMFLLPALTIYIWIRLLTSYSYCSTESNGIRLKGIILKSFIDWYDIKSIKLSPLYGTLNTIIIIETQKKKFKFEVDPDVLISIWQHLRRMGKMDGFVLPECALNLWAEITDEVPDNIEWISPMSFKHGYLTFMIIFAYICIAASVYIQLKVPPETLDIPATQTFPIVVCFASVIVIGAMYLPYTIKQKIIINDGYMEIFYLNGSEKVYWHDISSIHRNKSEIILKINTPNDKRKIGIPCVYTNEKSILFILSLIKKLRSIKHLRIIAIPFDIITAIKKKQKKQISP